jgi:hypothetical protein
MCLDPALQGQGVYSALNEFSFRRPDRSYDLTMMFSAHPVNVHLSKRNEAERGRPGRRDLGNPLRTFYRPIRFERLPDRGAPGAAEPDAPLSKTHAVLGGGSRRRPALLRALAWRWRHLAWRIRRGPLPRRNGWTVRRASSLDDRVDSLFAEAAQVFDFIQVRDAATLNWRYLDPRGGPFTVLVAEAGDRLLGYAAVQLAGERAELADLLVRPGRADVLLALVLDAVDAAKAAGAAGVGAWLPERHPYRAALERAGFHPTRAPAIGQFFAAPDLNEQAELLMRPGSRVHLMLGDSDHI